MKTRYSNYPWLLSLIVALASAQIALGQSNVVQPFPKLVDEPLSTTYTVKVNGQTVPVMRYEAGRAPSWGTSRTPRSVGVTQFAFAGEVEVEITISPGVPAGYILSPQSYQLQPVVSGNKITFSLDRPRKLMLHYGGELGLDEADGVSERLLLFAEPLADDVPDLQADNVINVQDRGIDQQGESFVADALQQAIDDAANLPGGGTVYVPAGTYNIDQGLSMRSNVSLYLARGCLIRATSVELNGETAPEGVIGFIGVNNAKLFGPGVIHANGSAFRKDADGAGKDYDHAVIVWLNQATDCIIKDVTLRDAANIHVFIDEFSERNYVYNAKLVTDSDYPNTDGINPNQASNNVIENCFIHNTDDPIAAGYNREINNIVVKNCVFWTYQGALKVLYQPFFPETAARNISFENSDLIYSTGVGSVSGGGRGPHEVKDIFYKNIRSEEVRQHQFQIRTTKDGELAPWDNGVYGKVKDIYIQRVTSAIQGVPIFGEPSYLLGKPDDSLGSHTTENVVFRNYQVAGKTITSLSELQAAGFETNQYLENIQFTQPEETEINVEVTSLYASESGTASAFEVVRSGNTDASLTIQYTLRGTAQNGTDYQNLGGTVTLAAGASSATVPINPIADGTSEEPETVFLTLEGAPFSTQYLLGSNYHAVIVIDDADVPPAPTSGTGLSYALYDNKTLSGTPLSTGTDATVNFDWKSGGRAADLPANNFSVRWTGQVRPQYSEEYTFYTRSDDGVRLWVNGEPLINNWTDHAATEDQGKITLQAGQKYDIRLEYYEKGGQAVCQLRWSSASQPKQVVPQPRLYPATVDEPSTATYTIRARGVQGTEEMALQINGQTVQSWMVSTTMADYTYTGEETGTVRVAIINDQGVNNDLQVDKLTVDGTVYQAEAQAVNTGVWQGQCGGSFSEWLHCPGHIEFDLGGTNARQADQSTKKLLTESLPEKRLFPNPSPDGSFTVQGIVDGRQVNLYDLQGRRVAITTQTVAPQRLLVQPRRDLPKGLYLLRIQQTNGKGWQSKVVVE